MGYLSSWLRPRIVRVAGALMIAGALTAGALIVGFSISAISLSCVFPRLADEYRLFNFLGENARAPFVVMDVVLHEARAEFTRGFISEHLGADKVALSERAELLKVFIDVYMAVC